MTDHMPAWGTQSSPAAEEFGAAVHIFATHRPNAVRALDRAIVMDPYFIAAHALKGFAALTMARPELNATARCAGEDAHNAALLVRATPSETALIEALDVALDGYFLEAAERIECRLRQEPENFLLLKLAHALRFLAGDRAGMLAATTNVLPFWNQSNRQSGYVFGCHAFGLEEDGNYSDAAKFGELALSLAPDDAWGLHALCHVYEMQGRTTEGIRQLERARPLWKQCNNFQFHMAWHLALHYLEAGDIVHVLDLYDREIYPNPSDDYRDISNATSLLWRLRLAGVDVGSRWLELKTIALPRAADTTLIFAGLHHLFSLVAAGEINAATQALNRWGEFSQRGTNDQARVARRVGLVLGKIIAGFPVPTSTYRDIAEQLSVLGGSRAQRDVFLQTLISMASKAKDVKTVQELLSMRRSQRAIDRVDETTATASGYGSLIQKARSPEIR
jgi:tetratricopeptide (TPR) repeat protein